MQAQRTFQNGWTASAITDGYGSPSHPYEVWAWHKDGRTDPDVTGYCTEEMVTEFFDAVEARVEVEWLREVERNREIDEAIEFGKRLKALLSAAEGIPTGSPGVSLIDRPTKGCLIVHSREGTTYLVEFTRCHDDNRRDEAEVPDDATEAESWDAWERGRA